MTESRVASSTINETSRFHNMATASAIKRPAARRKLYCEPMANGSAFEYVRRSSPLREKTAFNSLYVPEVIRATETDISGEVEVVIVQGMWEGLQQQGLNNGNIYVQSQRSSVGDNQFLGTMSELPQIRMDNNMYTYQNKKDYFYTKTDYGNNYTSKQTPMQNGTRQWHTPASTTSTRRPPSKEGDESNLMWLLNFNVDSLFNASGGIDKDCKHMDKGKTPNQAGFNDTGRFLSTHSFSCNPQMGSGIDASMRSPSPSPSESCLTPTSSNGSCSMYTPQETSVSDDPRRRKPPYTYTELIEQALKEKGELTVSGIYQWISEHFPFYRADDDRWKNSVRHNLSINPYFKKGTKARHGSGHLWTIANKDDRARGFWARRGGMSAERAMATAGGMCGINVGFPRRRRIEEMSEGEREQRLLQAAVASIVGDNVINMEDLTGPDDPFCQPLSFEQDDNKENRDTFITPHIMSPPQMVSLEQSAGEILAGVKRDVEVQFVTGDTDFCPDQEFLSPLSKHDLMVGTALLDDPLGDDASLSCFSTDGEVLFDSDLNLGYTYEVSSPSQLHVV